MEELLIPFSKALNTANRVLELLTPHCEVINIAGSIRREKDKVKDIEIVCIPKKYFIQTDLLGGGYNAAVPEFISAVEAMTFKRLKGKLNTGRYVKSILKGGTPLDLFMPAPEDYYRQFATRTGSTEYAHNIIAAAWKRKGWCGSDHGLRRITDCAKTNSGNWKCINLVGEIPPVWKSEQEFFEWLNLKWIEPRHREMFLS